MHDNRKNIFNIKILHELTDYAHQNTDFLIKK